MRVGSSVRRFLPIAAGVGLVLGIACAGFIHKRDQIHFSHKKHVVEEELECEECHSAIVDSNKVTESVFPSEKKCMECHDKEEGGCGQCHADPKRPTTWQTHRVQSVVFSHATHLGAKGKDGKKIECTDCHGDVRDAESPRMTGTPRMYDTCMNCHRNDFREIKCKKCHEDLIENPARPVRLFSHDADFMQRHGTLARGDEKVCEHCHRQDYCADCHSRLDVLSPALRHTERVDRDLVHRGDFLTRHFIDARADPARCRKCHAENQCASCHERRGVSAKSKGASARHPEGWMNPASPNFHGPKARRDIASCATCHDQGAASNCVRCHRVGGAGGNPHPPGWNPRGDRDRTMCRSCHL
ncbi:MAG: hypothetical protein GXP54_10910 [Deltaproteobacteria bacterium]|nr:hypothetical protein [Deltaproteobacteria bacterium]